MRRISTLTAVLVTALAVWAPAASAGSLYNQVLGIYQSHGGTIPPCKFTSAQLEAVQKSADTYANQYFADFANAIDNALSQRASGACGGAGSSGQVAPAKTAPGPPLPLGPVTASTRAGVPAPIVLLAVLVALPLVGIGIWWLASVRGWDPAWAASWRHAWSEAEFRIGGGWANLIDRRRGRR